MSAADDLLRERLRRVKLVLTDCDGVLTDGSVYYSELGERFKRFNIRDGMGVERLRVLANVESAIVTGEVSESVVRRAEKLGIVECHLGAKDKASVVRSILARRDLSGAEVAYLGDDVNDLPGFELAGVTACPRDAVDEIKMRADIVLTHRGGEGAFREFAEILLVAVGAKPSPLLAADR